MSDKGTDKGTPSRPLRVVLCWHMHQPHYFDRDTGSYQLPWTYLHATKDYVDMAAIIEQCEGARAVVNFAPILLEQIDDYAKQVRDYLATEKPIRDPLLAALASPALPAGKEYRLWLVNACLRVNRARVIERFAPFKFLAEFARCIDDHAQAIRYFDDRYFYDLVTWYHLGWLGETVRRDDPRVKALLKQEHNYSHSDRLTLLEVIGELIGGVIERYRRLAEAGRVELSASPYAHPIVPLLLDPHSAREALPEVALPEPASYPGGAERSLWHLRHGIDVFKRHFGLAPAGCWPSEGGVSDAAIKLFAKAGFRWVASGESVLRNSLERSGLNHIGCIHRPYRLKGAKAACFFRDDGLSDLIGFTYSDWHADDAVNNFVHHLENIAEACADEPDRVVPVILDGENAWEYYPENGFHFLTALYRRLADHPAIELTTFSDALAAGCKPLELETVVAGSWVYGSFSTWIGDPDKNRGWELLVHAKEAFDRAKKSGRLKGAKLREAEQQLAICEGSDWFWWFGDYNPADTVLDFERLYRVQLAALYHLIGEEPPDYLSDVISRGGGAAEQGGTMRRGKESA